MPQFYACATVMGLVAAWVGGGAVWSARRETAARLRRETAEPAALQADHRLESLVSRESSFLFNNLVLLTACFVILWGTLFPILSEYVEGSKVTVGAPFYNRVAIPIGLFLHLGKFAPYLDQF